MLAAVKSTDLEAKLEITDSARLASFTSAKFPENKKHLEENHTTTSINLFSGNFADVKDANPAESVISSFASKSVDLTAASNQDKSEITSSVSIRKSHRTISRASRPILKSAVRSSADRELDNMTGKPNLISRKKSEDILRYIIK